jgi:hypothetical protein
MNISHIQTLNKLKQVWHVGTVAAVVILIIAAVVIWRVMIKPSDEILPAQFSQGATSADQQLTIDYTDAPEHIGEKLTVKGTVLKVFTTKSGVTFFDYCTSSYSCPFSAVIFASDTPNFKSLADYTGEILVTGIIKSYQGKAEMVLQDSGQISR